MCRCPHSYPRHYKEVIGQLQAPDAFLPEKRRYQLKGRLGRPQSSVEFWKRKIPRPCRESNLRLASQ